MWVVSPGFTRLSVQFPRDLHAEGAHYLVETPEPSAGGSCCRATGTTRRPVVLGIKTNEPP